MGSGDTFGASQLTLDPLARAEVQWAFGEGSQPIERACQRWRRSMSLIIDKKPGWPILET